MDYEINYEIEVTGHLKCCREIGSNWIKSIITAVPTAFAMLNKLNERNENSEKKNIVNLGIVSEIYGEEEKSYYELGSIPLTIKLWWGVGRNGIHINNNFDAIGTILKISHKHQNSIFKIIETGTIYGSYYHSETVIFSGQKVAKIESVA